MADIDTLAARMRAAYVGEDAIAFDELKPEVRARWERVAAVACPAPTMTMEELQEDFNQFAERHNAGLRGGVSPFDSEPMTPEQIEIEKLKKEIRDDHDAACEFISSIEFERDALRAELADWKAGRYRAVVAGPEHAGTYSPVVVSPIPVPFSDAQIDAMAKAARRVLLGSSETDANWPLWYSAIRAALAAGGLEPCAVPVDSEHELWKRIEPGLGEHIEPLVDAYLRGHMEVTGQKESSISYSRVGLSYVRDAVIGSLIVAVSERASDEELADAHDAEFAAAFASGVDARTPAVRAVRARVEAPLLAEIQRLDIENRDRAFYVREFAAVSQERDTLKARVAELEAGKAGWCERDRGNLLLEMSGLRDQLTALRQPVDPDAWKTPLVMGFPDAVSSTKFAARDDGFDIDVSHGREHSLGVKHDNPADAARAAQWLASYATAHGCSVDGEEITPATEQLPTIDEFRVNVGKNCGGGLNWYLICNIADGMHSWLSRAALEGE